METTAANTFRIFDSTPSSKAYNYLKVNQTLYSPGQAMNVPGERDSQISRKTGHESG
jgi:hypothetical protein